MGSYVSYEIGCQLQNMVMLLTSIL